LINGMLAYQPMAAVRPPLPPSKSSLKEPDPSKDWKAITPNVQFAEASARQVTLRVHVPSPLHEVVPSNTRLE
jgi:hypothetical protein